MIGFVLGASCGLLFGSSAMTLGALYLLSTGRQRNGLLGLMPSRMAMPIAFVALSLFVPLIGSLVGGILGLVYPTAAAAYPGGGLASPNLAFSLAMLLLALAPLVAWLTQWRRPPWEVAVLSLSFAVVFGWLLPWLVSA